jgi:hypothetical protein
MENLQELMRNTMDDAHVILDRAKTREEFLAINGSLLAVVQGMYVKFMGNESTAMMFYSIADRLVVKND